MRITNSKLDREDFLGIRFIVFQVPATFHFDLRLFPFSTFALPLSFFFFFFFRFSHLNSVSRSPFSPPESQISFSFCCKINSTVSLTSFSLFSLYICELATNWTDNWPPPQSVSQKQVGPCVHVHLCVSVCMCISGHLFYKREKEREKGRR